MISVDYSYWTHHIKNFKEHFGERLGINDCELQINENSSTNSPGIVFGNIIMPTQYLNLLNLHCNLILSNRNLFQNFGDYSKECLDEENYEIPDYTLPANDFNRKYLLEIPNNDRIPNDIRRTKVAALLRDMITYFAIYHELGHARQVAYAPIEEPSVENTHSEKWSNQVLEVDADIFAINWLWRTILFNYHNFGSTEAVVDKVELIELALYSTFLLYVLSNNSSQLFNPYNKYPHPIVRFEITTIFLKEILLKNLFTNEELEKVVKKMMPEFDKILFFHFGMSNRREYYNKFKSEELKRIKEIIQEHLEKNPALNRNRRYNIE